MSWKSHHLEDAEGEGTLLQMEHTCKHKYNYIIREFLKTRYLPPKIIQIETEDSEHCNKNLDFKLEESGDRFSASSSSAIYSLPDLGLLKDKNDPQDKDSSDWGAIISCR